MAGRNHGVASFILDSEETYFCLAPPKRPLERLYRIREMRRNEQIIKHTPSTPLGLQVP
jgi:hypothetical protein